MAAKVVSLVVRGCTGKLNINIQQEITVKVAIKLFDLKRKKHGIVTGASYSSNYVSNCH